MLARSGLLRGRNNSRSTLLPICTLVVLLILKLQWTVSSPCPVAPLISNAAFHRLLPMPISKELDTQLASSDREMGWWPRNHRPAKIGQPECNVTVPVISGYKARDTLNVTVGRNGLRDKAFVTSRICLGKTKSSSVQECGEDVHSSNNCTR